MWCDQIRFNKSREYIPRGFRLLTKGGIKEWDGTSWIFKPGSNIAVLSTGKIKQKNERKVD